MKIASITLLLASSMPLTKAWSDPYYEHALDSRDADPYYYDDIELYAREADDDFELYDRSYYVDSDYDLVGRDEELDDFFSLHYVRGDADQKQKLKKAATGLSDSVKVTLGPKGRNVVLDKTFGAPRITKDGVSVAKETDPKGLKRAHTF